MLDVCVPQVLVDEDIQLGESVIKLNPDPVRALAYITALPLTATNDPSFFLSAINFDQSLTTTNQVL